MSYANYQSLSIQRECGVAFVTINHPPMNLLDVPLVKELSNFLDEAQSDDAVWVIVFESDDPEYFLAHYDVQDLLTRPVQPGKAGIITSSFQQLVERYARFREIKQLGRGELARGKRGCDRLLKR